MRGRRALRSRKARSLTATDESAKASSISEAGMRSRAEMSNEEVATLRELLKKTGQTLRTKMTDGRLMDAV